MHTHPERVHMSAWLMGQEKKGVVHHPLTCQILILLLINKVWHTIKI